MSLLKKLFGIGGPSTDEAKAPEVLAEAEHEGFRIEARPIPEGGQYRLAATISGRIDGEERRHEMIRADLFPSKDDAAAAALRKAKQMIDEQGDAIFSR